MKIKNIITFFLTILMVLSFVACDKNSSEEAVESSETIESNETTVESSTTAIESSETTIEEVSLENDDMPVAYQEIISRCNEILDLYETGEYQISESEGSLFYFAELVGALGVEESRDLFCYSLTDLNNDGITELILASKCETEHLEIDYRAGYSILNIYTLDGDKAVSLASAYHRSKWYINSDGLIINDSSYNLGYRELNVYSLDANSSRLKENLKLYIRWLEESDEIGLMESIDGSEDTVIDTVGDPEDSKLYDKLVEVRDQYLVDLYQLELVKISD